MNMFCYQCEQTAGSHACMRRGVCGKNDRTAALQDLLVHLCKEIAVLAGPHHTDSPAASFVIDALFSTVTNVDFDQTRLEMSVTDAVAVRNRLRDAAGKGPIEELLDVPADLEDMIELGHSVSIEHRLRRLGPTVTGLQELILYGLKGAAAYAHHAEALEKSDASLSSQFLAVLDYLADEPSDVESLLEQALHVGSLNYKVMELLDEAHTGHFGDPTPTTVRVTPIAGKCIVVSGHDLRDLDLLLRQTEQSGIHVYTHGEMLPALAYPGLRRYPHLVGNYGGAWQDQHKEFDAFPGAILMTTNCLQEPMATYRDRLFTTGLVAWPGIRHIAADKDFTPLVETALACEGFSHHAMQKTITIGFAHHALSARMPQLADAIHEGRIRHIFVIGGCDGARSGRNYYTDLALEVPDNCIIMTLACGKYRFNKLEFGTIDGIPRLLDAGQCNDAYSVIRTLVELADALDCDVNELPVSMVLSWYEQKALAILLTLLYLGIQNIRVGPTMPAVLTTQAAEMLIDHFGLQAITTPKEDLSTILGVTSPK